MPEIAQASVALLARHPLRTGDAIQLAYEAARAEGVPLLASS
jgi:hypothetical protein